MTKDLKERIAEEWEMLDPVDPLRGLLSDVIDVLAQPAQEPVAWTVKGKVNNWSKDFSAYQTQHYTRPVYITPQQRPWVGLTDNDYLNALDNHPFEGSDRELWLVLEAKLKEKNNG